MPRYKVRMDWSETVQYHSVVEVEAEDEDEARDMASDRQYDDYDSGDSSNDDNLEYEVECLDDQEEDKPKKKKNKWGVTTRNLPDWF